MTPEELLAELEGKNDAQACRIIEACGAYMREHRDADVEGLAAALVDLAARASSRVARAVAGVCDAFPGPFFEEARALFEGSADGKTREAVSLAIARRAARTAKPGVDPTIARLFHELARGQDHNAAALAALKAEIAKPQPNRAALAGHAKTLEERMAAQWAAVVRCRDFARAIEPVFVRAPALELIAASLMTVSRALPQANIDVVASPRDLVLHVDRHAMGQALENVMKNAVESYGPRAEQAPVRVTARAVEEGSRVAIAVADKGAGMTEEERARLFVASGSKKAGGMGIGMLVVRKMVVDVHRGEIAVESTPGAGTTVTLLVPARQSA